MSSKRGKLLTYDTATGKGLVSVQGEKIPFDVTNWKTDKVPTVGMSIEITTADDGTTSFEPVDNTEAVKEQFSKFGDRLSKEGSVVAKEFVDHVGIPVLAGYGVFLVATLFLNFVNISVFGLGGGGAALISFGNALVVLLLLVAYASVATTYFWKNQLAWLAYALPLVVLLVAFLQMWGTYRDATAGMRAFLGSGGPSLFDIVKPGPGFFLSLIAAAFLAFVGIQNYLKKKPL